MLGKRFLLLNHVGRKSGKPRQAALEIVDYDEETDTYYIASGFGKKSDWYKNLAKTPKVMIQVGRKKRAVTAVFFPPDQSGQAMLDYARRYPRAGKNIARICGYTVDGSDEDYFILGRDIIPFIALKPPR